jgi:hypothetical protein
VPVDFWDAWIKQHRDFQWVKNGSIFAVPNEDAEAEAQKMRAVKTGMEQLDPNRPGPGLTPESGKAI